LRIVLPRRTAIAAGLACVIRPGSARAHAILESSEPALNGSTASGPLRVRLRFNSRVDPARSSLLLTRPDKSRVALVIDSDPPPDTLTATATLGPGAHVLRWQVLALDGHITRGDVPFLVVG
jgi:methionine-rich copper-binding protein CopC